MRAIVCTKYGSLIEGQASQHAKSGVLGCLVEDVTSTSASQLEAVRH